MELDYRYSVGTLPLLVKDRRDAEEVARMWSSRCLGFISVTDRVTGLEVACYSRGVNVQGEQLSIEAIA